MIELIPAFAGKSVVPAPFTEYLLKKEFSNIEILRSIEKDSNAIIVNRVYKNDMNRSTRVLNDNDIFKMINIDSKDIDNDGNVSHDIEMDIAKSGHITNYDKVDEDQNKISILKSVCEVPFTFPPRASDRKSVV